MKRGIFIHEDNHRPSPRQLHVIELVAKGFKNRELAKKLGMSQHVVPNYLGIIYNKVGVSNRVELALWYEARVHEGKFRRKGTYRPALARRVFTILSVATNNLLGALICPRT